MTNYNLQNKLLFKFAFYMLHKPFPLELVVCLGARPEIWTLSEYFGLKQVVVGRMY